MAASTTGLWILLSTLCMSFALPAPRNVTIDDYYGDPLTGEQFNYTYNSWNVGQQRPGCYAQPDPALLYAGTWHDTTRHNGSSGSASVIFPATDNPTFAYPFVASENMTFLIDGQVSGSFAADPSTINGPNSTYEYNVLLFHQDALSNEFHNFTLANGFNSLVLLDYLVYTSFEPTALSNSAMPTLSEPTSSTAFGSNTGSSGPTVAFHRLSKPIIIVIAVMTVQGCILSIVVIGAIYYWRKQRRTRDTSRLLVPSSLVESLRARSLPPAYDYITSQSFLADPCTPNTAPDVVGGHGYYIGARHGRG
ncbi:hypothetical protein CERSUDRAFT_75422 [Gelatoporia subvermispora B]|uniref:Glycoside hydrolase family 16 protein n=1 Tax=Ceriporiopsis subvermispora (strain B) TaxID=914234 RepID=M2PGI8_CERS8|nr:hypothetical protein CERSUDRAFT_75422 [Gelatoporia subvermispora B]